MGIALLVVLMWLGVTASAQQPPAPNEGPHQMEVAACVAEKYAYVIGRRGDSLLGFWFLGPVRLVPPGVVVTMDYNPTRINLELDAEGVIIGVYCG